MLSFRKNRWSNSEKTYGQTEGQMEGWMDGEITMKRIENYNDNKWKQNIFLQSSFRRDAHYIFQKLNIYLKLEFRINAFSEPSNWRPP